jgi:hypothetical protein
MRYLFFRLANFLKRPFSQYSRRKRLRVFLKEMKLTGGERIIDLGGSAVFWTDVEPGLNLTVVNLPSELSKSEMPAQHTFVYLEADACNLEQYPDNSFDIAYSNSVIEHVGGESRRQSFAAEARRLAPKYWVQTPSIYFPIEAHNHMPFWWFYPASVKRFFIGRWSKKLPAWTVMIVGTTVLDIKELKALFPDGLVYTERVLGFIKSYSLFRR